MRGLRYAPLEGSGTLMVNAPPGGWSLTPTEKTALFGSSSRLLGEEAADSAQDMAASDLESAIARQTREQQAARAKAAIQRCELITTVAVSAITAGAFFALWLQGYTLF